MDESPPLLCGNCAIQLSVKHILKECPQYSADMANIFGHAASLALILGDSSVEIYGKLYKVLIKINIYFKKKYFNQNRTMLLSKQSKP